MTAGVYSQYSSLYMPYILEMLSSDKRTEGKKSARRFLEAG